MSEEDKTEDEYGTIILMRRKVNGQILDWATALEMNAVSKDDPALLVAAAMRDWLRRL